ASVVSLRRGLHAGGRLHAEAERAYPHRHRLWPLVPAHAALDRPLRARRLPDAVRAADDLVLRPLCPAVVPLAGSVHQRRRADHLAGQDAAADRLCPALPSGGFGNHQEDRRHARPDRGSPPLRLRSRRGRTRRRGAGLGDPQMMEFIALNMAPIMFASLVIFLLLGYPVAFALAANGLLFFFIGVELAPLSEGAINLSWPLLNTMPGRLWGLLSNETLLAIPFFTFMGIVLERSGMAEDLLDTVGQLFGPVRGGLAYAVIIVGALLAATTGVVAASVIA